MEKQFPGSSTMEFCVQFKMEEIVRDLILSLWPYVPSGATGDDLLKEKVEFLEFLASPKGKNFLTSFAKELVRNLPEFKEAAISSVNECVRIRRSSIYDDIYSGIRDILTTSYGEVFTHDRFWCIWNSKDLDDDNYSFYYSNSTLFNEFEENFTLEILRELFPNRRLVIMGGEICYSVLYDCHCKYSDYWFPEHKDVLCDYVSNALIPNGIILPPDVNPDSKTWLEECFTFQTEEDSWNPEKRYNKFLICVFLFAKKKRITNEYFSGKIAHISISDEWFCWENDNDREFLSSSNKEAKSLAKNACSKSSSYKYRLVDSGSFFDRGGY